MAFDTSSHDNAARPISASKSTRCRLLDEANAEIDAIIAEYHTRLPREQARSVGAIYARFSTRFQHSIGDQVRSLCEAALQKQIYVPRNHVCIDVAVRGNKHRRPGLNHLRELVGRKPRQIDVLLIFATNRLARKTYRALQFVEEEIVDQGVRCIFTSTGIDTADKGRWELMLQINAMMDESAGTAYANHVRAAQEGLFDRGLIHGSLPLGYRGKEVPGSPTRRKLPRRAVEIDPETAPWVIRAFRWYADDRVSIGEIARRFNADPGCPKGSKFVTDTWTAKTIRYLLSNSRYRGSWHYGVLKNVWLSKRDYGRQVPRPEPLRSDQREDLRIVDDDLWNRAQQRLERNDRSAAGRKPRDGDRHSRPLLLNGIFVCGAHGQRMYVGGMNGLAYFCKECRALPVENRPTFSLLNRERAHALTCQALAELIRGDRDLVSRVIAACRAQVVASQRPDPGHRNSLKSRRDALTRQIDFITKDPGDTDFDREESRAKVRQLRQERSRITAELEAIEKAANLPSILPDESNVRELIDNLGEILAAAGSDHTPEGVNRARQVVEILTGGRIELHQMGERRRHRGWLQGRFRIRLITGLVESLTGVARDQNTDSDEITIDYNEPSPSEEIADRVKEHFDRGLLIKAIARELGITRNQTSKALDHWYRRRNLPRPDGRTRRFTLEQKHRLAPRFIAISEQIMEHFHEGRSYDQIAAHFACDRNTVTKVIGRWHELRGLPIPDGRNRRKELNRIRDCQADQATPPMA